MTWRMSLVQAQHRAPFFPFLFLSVLAKVFMQSQPNNKGGVLWLDLIITGFVDNIR